MIPWALERREVHIDRTLGRLKVDGTEFCWTLEPGLAVAEHPAIPEGAYHVTLTPSERVRLGYLWSPESDYSLPLLEAVPGRTGIRIHAGNVPSNTEGCILVGDRGPANDLTRSRTTLIQLIDLLRGYVARDIQGVRLTVSTRQSGAPIEWA
jgi:hypothetical protein